MKTKIIATIGIAGVASMALANYWARLDIEKNIGNSVFGGSPRPPGFYYWACHIAGYAGLTLIGVSVVWIAASVVAYSVRRIRTHRA